MSVRTVGFNEFSGKLRQKSATIQRGAKAEVLAAAKDWESLAKRSAPVHNDRLGKSIKAARTSDFSAEVSANVHYAPFVEWGTKKKRRVPADLVNYAASIPYQKKGDYYDFLANILEWVEKNRGKLGVQVKGRGSKNALLDAAQKIALSIIRHGIKPSPFFFKHRQKVNADFRNRLKALLS